MKEIQKHEFVGIRLIKDVQNIQEDEVRGKNKIQNY